MVFHFPTLDVPGSGGRRSRSQHDWKLRIQAWTLPLPIICLIIIHLHIQNKSVHGGNILNRLQKATRVLRSDYT